MRNTLSQSGFHSLSLLEGFIALLKEHCSEVEYNEFLKSIASVSGHLMTDLFKKVFQEYPDLENEVEEKINKYGKFI